MIIFMAKTIRFTVLLDEFERDKLERIAASSGSTRGEALRQLIRKAKTKRVAEYDYIHKSQL